MDSVAVAEEQVVSIDSIAAGVRGLRIAFVNVFSVEHPDGSWTLVDAALPMSESYIKHWAEKIHDRPPSAILLTHGHFDHVSAAKGLADEWNVPIFAHSLEFPYLTGQREYPRPDVSADGGLMTLLSPLYPRSAVDLGSRLHELSGVPEGMPGWQVLHTPGHTPGHISLLREEDRTLLAGDAFCTTKPESFFEAALAQDPELHGPPAYFTSDPVAARQSIQRLAALAPATVAPGHGKPLSGPEVALALSRLSY